MHLIIIKTILPLSKDYTIMILPICVCLGILSMSLLMKPLLTNIKEYPLAVMTCVFLFWAITTKTDIGPLEFVLSFCVLWIISLVSLCCLTYIRILWEELNMKLKANNSVTIAVFEWLKNQQVILGLILIITIYFTM